MFHRVFLLVSFSSFLFTFIYGVYLFTWRHLPGVPFSLCLYFSFVNWGSPLCMYSFCNLFFCLFILSTVLFVTNLLMIPFYQWNERINRFNFYLVFTLSSRNSCEYIWASRIIFTLHALKATLKTFFFILWIIFNTWYETLGLRHARLGLEE